MSEASRDILLQYGINPSVQRIAIMDYLLAHHTHPTVDDVYVALSEKIPTLSRTTVYNTLRLFSEQGAAQMLTIDERKVCFDGCVAPHAHFMCKRCGRVIDVQLPGEAVTQSLPEGDFRVDESHIYYKGICADCLHEQTGEAEVIQRD